MKWSAGLSQRIPLLVRRGISLVPPLLPFGQKVFTKRRVKSEYVLEKDLLESSVL
jgi:hypothetical protein